MRGMRELVIEWRHYDKEGATCDRCAATGSSLREVVAELSREYGDTGIAVRLVETRLPREQMAQSNLVLFNGRPLESLLDAAVAGENECQSCSCLTGSQTSCRTVAHEGTTYEELPAWLIRKAAKRAVEEL